MELTCHTLQDYIGLLTRRGLLAENAPGVPNGAAPVKLVSYDSREVVPGTLFLCKGAHFKGEFLQSAKDRGAIAYVSTAPYPEVDLPCIPVNDMRAAIAPLADLFYDHPSGKLKVIGITGTKGKSSTAYYLKHILDGLEEGLGRPETAVISSIDTYDGVERFESHITTPDAVDLQRHFANAAASGIGYLTMEVSSQALKYHRSLCTDFAAACFLNIGEDHISPIEHPDFEDYFTSKLRIFRQGAVNCVNLDCDHAGRVLEAARAAGKPIITFSQKDPSAQVYADQVRKEGRDILFHVRAEGLDRTFRLTMPGLFNVENALAAISICLALHIPEDAIYAGLLRARVPGRMEVYANADDTVVAIVDYAHNRMSFETLFSSVKKEYPGRRVVAVFGCPGKKAYDRRQALGEVSGNCSDLVILTEEDAGEEDPEAISKEIAQYVKCPCVIQNNRGEAIRQAILGCGRTPSVLLITGKGAETRQKRGTAYIDVPSDVDYVHAFLQEYDAVHHLGGEDQTIDLLTALPVLKQLADRPLAVCWDGEPGGTTALEDTAILEMAGIDAKLIREGEADAARQAGAGQILFLARQDLDFAPGAGRMDAKFARQLLGEGKVSGNAARLLARAAEQVERGLPRAAVIDQRRPHALLLYLLGRDVPAVTVE